MLDPRDRALRKLLRCLRRAARQLEALDLGDGRGPLPYSAAIIRRELDSMARDLGRARPAKGVDR